MKSLAITSLSLAACLGSIPCAVAQENQNPASPPPLWVYRDQDAPQLPFNPHGVMPKEGAGMLSVNYATRAGAHKEEDAAKPVPAKGETCIAVRVMWKSPWWVGNAWISGPDAFWGEEPKGKPHDLSAFKRLVLHARGKKGGEVVIFKIGILGDKPHGDSLTLPIEKTIKLSPEWQRFEIELTDKEQLKSIVSGFVFVLSQGDQPGMAETTEFFLDTIYFE